MGVLTHLRNKLQVADLSRDVKVSDPPPEIGYEPEGRKSGEKNFHLKSQSLTKSFKALESAFEVKILFDRTGSALEDLRRSGRGMTARQE